jgi:hypothetical protein
VSFARHDAHFAHDPDGHVLNIVGRQLDASRLVRVDRRPSVLGIPERVESDVFLSHQVIQCRHIVREQCGPKLLARVKKAFFVAQFTPPMQSPMFVPAAMRPDFP